MKPFYLKTIITSAVVISIVLAAPLMTQELQVHAQNGTEVNEIDETVINSLVFLHPFTRDQVLDFAPLHSAPLELTWVFKSSLRAASRSRTDGTQLPTANYRLQTANILQSPVYSSINLQLSSSIISGSADSLPFHLHANRLGTVDPNSTNFLNRIQLSGVLTEWKGLTLDYGTDVALRVSENSTAFFPELYLGAEYGAFRLDAGRFDRPIGLNNHDLSIGSMMVSRNAVPIPRIMISNPEFTDMPWTNGILEFKGMFSHGWFTDDRYTDSPYLHQKYLYLKVNTGPVSVIGGIVHNAFWGGTHPTLGRAPQSFDDYLRILFSRPADPDSNAPPGQISNALGNSLAAYEFALEYDGDDFDLSATRLFYLEDSVSKRFRSPWDGVWGINLTFEERGRLLNTITYEHINTRRQDAKADQERGRANYYNHSYYRSGWSHYNRTIGNPLIIRNQETDRVDNNIIVGHHLGLTGDFHTSLKYKLLGTYTRNYGIGMGKAPRGSIDFSERREDNYSLMLELGYSPFADQNLEISAAAALDTGEFYGNRFGGGIGVRYTFE